MGLVARWLGYESSTEAMMLRLVLTSMALMLASCSTCSAEKPKADAFSCEQLQTRAELCAPQTLARVKGDLASRTDAEEQYKMFELRFKKRLTEKKTKAQCEKFTATAPARVDQMRDCYGREDCDGFAACMLQL